MVTFEEALANLEDAKRDYRNTNNQSRWYKSSPEVMSATLAMIEVAESREEAEVALEKAPASSDAKFAAYLKLMSFCDSIESFYRTSQSWRYRLGSRFNKYPFDLSEREFYLFEHEWERVSIEAVGAAGSLTELAKLYVIGYIFGKAIDIARVRLEEAFDNCTSFKELNKLEETIPIPSSNGWHDYPGSLRQMHNNTHDRLYFEKYGERFRRQSINSDCLL